MELEQNSAEKVARHAPDPDAMARAVRKVNAELARGLPPELPWQLLRSGRMRRILHDDDGRFASLRSDAIPDGVYRIDGGEFLLHFAGGVLVGVALAIEANGWGEPGVARIPATSINEIEMPPAA